MTPSTEPITDRPLRVAAMGDLHVRDSHEEPYREVFMEISERADVLVLAGDLTNLGKTSEAQILAEELKFCRIPVLAVLGNHDHECGQPEVVKQHLTDVGVKVLDGGEAFEVHGVGFAGCMGAMGGFGRGMLSSFGEGYVKAFVEEAVKENMKLETGLRMLRTPRTVAVLHYAPITDTLVGEPTEILPFLGNSRLAETVDLFDNVSAVFHGHAHRGAPFGRTPRGVPVYNCAQMVAMAEHGRPYVLIEV